MTDPLSESRLAEISDRAEKATPGPWSAKPHGKVARCLTVQNGGERHIAYYLDGTDNAEFLAHARADIPDLLAEVDRLTRELAEAQDALLAGEASDGHHTHNELYDYRMLYNAAAVNAWWDLGTVDVVKSWRHSDGETCFGGGWFIVVATLPTGQVSNHYRAEHWDLFQVPEVDRPPTYDGHTPAKAADRLRAALSGGPS